jgi:hypothetical protein
LCATLREGSPNKERTATVGPKFYTVNAVEVRCTYMSSSAILSAERRLKAVENSVQLADVTASVVAIGCIGGKSKDAMFA